MRENEPKKASPPATVGIHQCDGCGKFTFTHPFKHYYNGRMCKGTVILYIYQLTVSA